MHDLTAIAGFLCACLLVAALMVWHFSRARSLLEQWARENHYEIIAAQYRHFGKGPFFWTSSKGQAVYHVTIRNAQGKTQSGWLRCGGWWAGMFSDKTEVRWEDNA